MIFDEAVFKKYRTPSVKELKQQNIKNEFHIEGACHPKPLLSYSGKHSGTKCLLSEIIHVSVYLYMCARMCMCIYMLVYVYMHVPVCTHIYVYMYVRDACLWQNQKGEQNGAILEA